MDSIREFSYLGAGNLDEPMLNAKNNYKHRVFGEPSDIYTQDVRHLFTCNAHPPHLTPEELWQNRVDSIRESSLRAISGTLSRHRKIKETIFIRHNQTVVPLLVTIRNNHLRQYTPHLSTQQ